MVVVQITKHLAHNKRIQSDKMDITRPFCR
jgi:hypothetical protein